MVAALYEDKNFNKHAIKKQQLEKVVCCLNAINVLYPKNQNEIKKFCQWTLILGVNYQAH